MKLGIIGTGKVGSALGRMAAEAGMEVLFSTRRPEAAQKAALEAGRHARAVTLETLDREAEIILLAVPYPAIASVVASLKQLAGKVVIDVSNPLNADHTELTLGHITSGAEENARLAPQAKWVKAFNATFAEVYASGQPEIDGKKVTIFYAGDDAAANEAVHRLIIALGFDAVNAGPLKNARYLEPLSMLNILMGRKQGLGTRIGYRLLR